MRKAFRVNLSTTLWRCNKPLRVKHGIAICEAVHKDEWSAERCPCQKVANLEMKVAELDKVINGLNICPNCHSVFWGSANNCKCTE